MNYVTVAMLADHAGKEVSTIRRALAADRTSVEKIPGARGLRIRITVANKFLAKYYPSAGPV